MKKKPRKLDPQPLRQHPGAPNTPFSDFFGAKPALKGTPERFARPHGSGSKGKGLTNDLRAGENPNLPHGDGTTVLKLSELLPRRVSIKRHIRIVLHLIRTKVFEKEAKI